jgi:hypothetical protein
MNPVYVFPAIVFAAFLFMIWTFWGMPGTGMGRRY